MTLVTWDTSGEGKVKRYILPLVTLLGTSWAAAGVFSGGGSSGITSLTGQVTGTGPGATATTITPLTVDSTKIKGLAVDSEKLAANAVNSEKVQTGAIETAKLADGAVTNQKIAEGAVGTGKVASDAITGVKIFNATIDTAKLNANIQAQLANANSAITALTGDATASGPGSAVLTISANAVDTGKILVGAVTNSKIATGAVDTDKVAADAITGVKILNATIDTAKLNADLQTKIWVASGGSSTLEQAISTYTTNGVIVPTGNVGIGTTAPATVLDVNGASTLRANLTITGSTLTVNAPNSQIGAMFTSLNDNAPPLRICNRTRSATCTNFVTFDVWNNGTFLIQSEGDNVIYFDYGTGMQISPPSVNVGIGTNTPGAKLDVLGDVLIELGSLDTNKIFMNVTADATPKLGIGTTAPAVNLHILSGSADTTKLQLGDATTPGCFIIGVSGGGCAECLVAPGTFIPTCTTDADCACDGS